MAQETANPTEWQEPDKGQNAGIGSWNRPNSPYDNFMESEGVPIYRGIGVERVQALPFKPWRRLGGRVRSFSSLAPKVCGVVTSSRFLAPMGSRPSAICTKRFT